MSLTQTEIKKRFEYLEGIIANQRLEGLEIDSQTLQDLQMEARGEIELQEAFKQLHKRIQNEQI